MKRIIFLSLVVLLFSGCDVLMEEIVSYADFRNLLYAPIDQDETPHVAGNGKDSYYPMVEGYVWKYAGDFEDGYREAEVRVTEVDPDGDGYPFRRILIENIDGTNGSLEHVEGHSHSEGSHFLESQIHMVAGYHPTFNIDDTYETLLGTTRTYSGNSNGYPAEATITYGGQLTDIRTPKGKEFEDCIHMRYEVDFPEGYDQDWYDKKAEAYMARGVGYVYVIIEDNLGEVDRIYVTNHSRFGERVRFFDDDGVSQLISSNVHVEGALITLPTLSKAGFELTGWSDGSDVYQPGDTFFMPDVDIDFTAQWTAHE